MTAVSAQLQKAQLLNRLVEIRRRILARSRQFERAMTAKSFIGQWTILELLAHLAGWDQANQEAAQAILAGRLPDFYTYAGKDWSEFNQILVVRHRRADLKQMLTEVSNTHQNLVAFLESLPMEIFTLDKGIRYKGYKVILGRLLQSEAEDEEQHLAQIERFITDQRSVHSDV